MKKSIIPFISIVVLLTVGSYVFAKINPPLALADGLAYQKGKKVILLEAGNQYPFGDIKLTDVLVNENLKPSEAKVQVSHPTNGFIITTDFNGKEAEEYHFLNLENAKLKPNTHPQKQLDKLNEGTLTDDDLIYAITLGHQSSIEKVTIKYQCLGIPYEKIVTTETPD
ncbi:MULTISPECIES: hypothetical protein [Pontibacillus]|uniref:DUF4198 domain-containing protein n=1 Tax=Pontibacillus chungwhensis TaxID=265426 RepID=A0ABY8V0S4_9BACI|nr:MULTISPECIES: hypothetical protein [Pontibacillus]MCD5324352.1 hypothetical protein [Pontibacillus sp. HN14]WIF99349.1 hypothetical protein QNI29_06745 [Pontibacillus chungwhensis]